jgi:hypothetical protein
MELTSAATSSFALRAVPTTKEAEGSHCEPSRMWLGGPLALDLFGHEKALLNSREASLTLVLKVLSRLSFLTLVLPCEVSYHSLCFCEV